MATIIPAGVGKATLRIDGRAKVTGAARYGSDEPVAAPAHAVLVTSAIARGRVIGFDLDEARRVPGMLDILTYQNAGSSAKTPPPSGGKGKATTTLESDRIWHAGQIIAIVVADSLEAAREAAHKVGVRYEEAPPSASFDSVGTTSETAASVTKGYEDPRVGDAAAAFAQAEVKIDAQYETPIQHHNPMELFTTTCVWSADRLTIYEPSQFVHSVKVEVAKQLGLRPEQVRVISRYVGGGFGSRGSITSRTAWVALAARRLNRPVKLVATRTQGFTIATHRAETRHHVKLGASRDGKLMSLSHEGSEVTSRPSTYNVAGTATTARMYACPHVWTRVNIVHADRNTPGFMRAPPETPYLFALESAMDELAVALNMDPVALRRVNDTQTEPIKGLPYSSRHLIACFEQAAERFGWSRRSLQPGSMRDGDWLVGWGCAAAAYHASIGAAAVRITMTQRGTVRIETAAHDIGTGAYTVIAMTAADRLGLPMQQISVEIGDSDFPPGGLAAGSTHTASVCTAVAKACDELRERIARAAVRATDSPFAGARSEQLSLTAASLRSESGASEPLEQAVGRLGGVIEVYAENVPAGAPPGAMQMLYQGQPAMARGSELKDQIRYSFGAHFVEVRVHALTREVRVPRAVGAFAAGTIVNPVTARSQLMGGMIWGLSAALHEKTEIDDKLARYTNTDLSEYLVPVNADIGSVEVIFVPEEDHDVNPLGIKGIGELGTTGMNAAVANAVHHATGIRIRTLPIRIENLLRP